jgi:putative Mn2+ efflux pump MntP
MSITAVATTAAGLILPLADRIPADKDVTAGWLAFAIFIGLGLAVVFLGFSLSKHLRRAEANLGTGKDTKDETTEENP